MTWSVTDLAGIVKLSSFAPARLSTGESDSSSIRISYSLTGEGGGSQVGREGTLELLAADLERK